MKPPTPGTTTDMGTMLNQQAERTKRVAAITEAFEAYRKGQEHTLLGDVDVQELAEHITAALP